MARAGVAVGDSGPEISSLSLDSRKVSPGSLFICMPGMTRDSESFLPDAAANGAVAAIVSTPQGLGQAQSLGLAAVRVEAGLAFDDVVWRVCDTFFDHPTRHMKVVAVTGTNGKTTTAWILRNMLESVGLRAAYIGTLGVRFEKTQRELPNTTPFAVDLYNLLAELREAGAQALAIELSSHALAQHRADGIEVDAAVFSNLTQDHLDFHGTMEEYEAAKLRLFAEFPSWSEKPFIAALNGEDAVGRGWSHQLACPAIVFGTHENLLEAVPASANPLPPVALVASGVADPIAFQAVAFEDHRRHLICHPEEIRVDRLKVCLHDPDRGDEGYVAEVRLGGSYNVQNTAAAAAAMVALGYSVEDTAKALEAVRPVPGRFEPVENEAGIGVLVDYAHTPDALEKLLDAVRPLTNGRVISVFGCGGDRDRNKRPKMARAASERSDITVITSDNPRTEDPAAILAEVATGLVPGKESAQIVDRGAAIAYAIAKAEPGDVVVIAGKGHENYQIIGREKIAMDDRDLAREALSRRTA